jgi:outer membrane immunogenic protein
MSIAGNAADLPVAPPPPPPIYAPLFSWTGFYFGGNLGAAWAAGNVTESLNGLGFGVPTNNPVFVGGGQAGFNYQFSNLVVGVEGTFDAASNRNNTGSGIAVPNVGIVQVSANNKWISTVAARFGVASDRWLVYGKAGWGWVGNNNLTITNLNTGASITGGSSSTNGGWLVGAGLEWAFAYNWTTKLEYDFIGLGSQSFTVPAGAPFLVGDTFTIGSNNRSVQMITVGVNYKFGWASPVVTQY